MTLDARSSWPVHFSAEIVFFLFKVGESLLEPTIRLFIYQGVCSEKIANVTACSNLRRYEHLEEGVQASAARDIMLYKVLLNLPAIVMALFCGAWSDRIGRKLPVMLPCFGTIVAVLFYMLALSTRNAPFLPFVMVGAAIRGLFGKSAIITMALYSYIADISSKEDRTERLGRLLAMNFFGYFVGSLTAGALLDVTSFNVIFCVVVAFYAACVLIALTCMRESVPVSAHVSANTVEVGSPVGKPCCCGIAHVRDSLSVFLRPRENRTRCHLILLFMVIVFNQTCKSGEIDVTLLFVERTPLNWQKSMYGYLLAVDYGCLGLAVLVILPALIHLFSFTDTTLVVIGIVFKLVRLVILALSSTTWMVYLSVVVGCPSAMIVSSVKSLISKLIDADDMGKAFALLACAETIANLVGSVLFTFMYSVALPMFPGFVFLIDVLFFVCLLGLTILLAQDMNAMWQYSLLSDAPAKPEDRTFKSNTTVFFKRPPGLQPIQENSE